MYRLRSKETGQYWLGGGYLSSHWGPKGKFFRRMTDIKNSFSWGMKRSYQDNWPTEGSELEIEVYELVHKETLPYESVPSKR